MSIRTCRHIEDLTDHDDMFLLLTSHVFSQTRVSITFSISSCRWWDGGRGCCARRRARKGKLKDESLLASQTDASKGSYKPRFPSLNSLLRASFFPKFWKISINTNFLKGRAVGYGPLNWTIMVHVSVPRKLQVQPEISKGGIFLKKLWCYIGGEWLTFRAFTPFQSNDEVLTPETSTLELFMVQWPIYIIISFDWNQIIAV